MKSVAVTLGVIVSTGTPVAACNFSKEELMLSLIGD